MWILLWPRLPQRVLDLWHLPSGLVLAHAQRQVECQRHTLHAARQPGAEPAQQAHRAWRDVIAAAWALPFDLARLQHAAAVQTGLLPRSLLESHRFEQQLDTLEKLSLGPLARGG